MKLFSIVLAIGCALTVHAAPSPTGQDAKLALRNAPGESSQVLSMSIQPSGASSAIVSTPSNGHTNVTNTGTKKYVAYWSIYHGPTLLPTDKQLKGVTHLILAFAFMGLGPPPYTATWPPEAAQQFSAEHIKTIQGKGIKVMVAVGGWGMDGAYRVASQSEANRAAFATSLITFMRTYGLDGIDLDWEYPVWNGENYKLDPAQFPVMARPRLDADGPNFVLLAQEIRKQLKAFGTEVSRDMVMSIAVPAKYEDTLAYQVPSTVKGLDKEVDFWNVMSYDFMNRRNNVTTHQSGGTVIEDNIKLYSEEFGISPDRLLFGIPMYAKFFYVQPGCEAPYMGCQGVPYENPKDGADLGMSGWVTFNTAVTENSTNVENWKRVPQNNNSDTKHSASAWVDNQKNIFWTWLSKDDVLAACKANIGKVGGIFIWSINQDNLADDGGEHIDAIQQCLAGSS